MCITKGELDRLHLPYPLTFSLELILELLILFAKIFGNLLLKFLIDHGDEVLIEVSPTHWACHTGLNHSLVTLEAHEMLARSDYRLGA